MIAFVTTEQDKSLMGLVTSRFRDRIWPLIFTSNSEKENFDPEPHLSTKVEKPLPLTTYVQDSCLNLSRKVHSDVFAGSVSGRFTVSELEHNLSLFQTESIKYLNLSSNVCLQFFFEVYF